MPLQVEGMACDPDQEQRLLYVAITRAKRLMVLSHAARRTLFGQALPGGPSPLLDRVAAPLLRRSTPSLPPPRPGDRQLSLFD